MTAAERTAERRKAWEHYTATPLVVLGILFIVAYSFWVLLPEERGQARTWIGWTLLISWAVFLVDVVVRIILTPHGQKWRFVWRHPVEVLSAVLPIFRALRVLVLLREVPYLQRRSGNAVRTNILIYAASYAVVFVYFISLATLNVERDAPGANITTFGDSIWWAIVTVATVGYGDEYPVTPAGRFYAVFLMAGGIAIVGTASATIISLINERVGSAKELEKQRRATSGGSATTEPTDDAGPPTTLSP